MSMGAASAGLALRACTSQNYAGFWRLGFFSRLFSGGLASSELNFGKLAVNMDFLSAHTRPDVQHTFEL